MARDPESLVDLEVAARLALDVTDAASVQRAAGEAGAIDVLVNNAAELVLGPVEGVPLERVRHLFEVNVIGALRMVHAFVPAMRERGDGLVINLSSVAGPCDVSAQRSLLRDQVRPRVALRSAALRARSLRGARGADPAAAIPTDEVARAIADTVDAPPSALRIPVGAAAGELQPARGSLDDATFDAAMRSTTGIDWAPR